MPDYHVYVYIIKGKLSLCIYSAWFDIKCSNQVMQPAMNQYYLKKDLNIAGSSAFSGYVQMLKIKLHFSVSTCAGDTRTTGLTASCALEYLMLIRFVTY